MKDFHVGVQILGKLELSNTIKMILAFAFDVNTPHLEIYPTEVL